MSSSSQSIPSGWPSDLIFLQKPCYSPNVSSKILTQVDPSSSDKRDGSSNHSAEVLPASSAVPPSPLVRIMSISDPGHPACGQSGLFAARALPPDSFVLCYLGWTHSADEADPTSSYDLSLDRELGVAVDATRMGNEARFINDYRGVRASGPNAEFRDVFVRVGKGQVERRVGVYVKAESKRRAKGKNKDSAIAKPKKGQALGIAKGEEIVVSYGKGFWKHHSTDAEAGTEEDPRDEF